MGNPRTDFKTSHVRYDTAMNRQQKRGGETWHGDASAKPNGRRFVSISPHPRLHPAVDARGWMIGVAWRASSGSSGPAPTGVSCPPAWQPRHLLAPAQALGRDGCAAHALARLLGPAQRPAAAALGRMRCRWELRPGEKRGRKGGKTTRGKGTKWMVLVDGAGTSVGSRPGGGVPGGRHPPRAGPQHGRGRAAWPSRAAPETARASARRSGLCQQSPACPVGPAGH
jgi:hypothetical protein